MKTPEGASVPAMIVRFKAVDCTVADFKSKYADWFDVDRFNSMFSDGCNAIMRDRCRVKRDTDIGGRNRRQNLM